MGDKLIMNHQIIQNTTNYDIQSKQMPNIYSFVSQNLGFIYECYNWEKTMHEILME